MFSSIFLINLNLNVFIHLFLLIIRLEEIANESKNFT